MKKLLVVLLATMMVATVGASAMAAVTVSGDSLFTQDFSVDDPDGVTANSTKLDLNVYFKNKVSDTIDWTLRCYMSGRDKDLATPLVREAYANASLGDAGSLKFGLWEVKPYSSIGILADNTDSVMGRMQDPFAVGYTSPELFSGFTAGLVYFIDGSASTDWYNTRTLADGAYVANLTYNAGMVFADLYLVNTAIDGQKTGYALNVKVTPIDVLTVGLNMGTNPEEKEAQIVELQYKQDALCVKYGVDLNDDATTQLYSEAFSRTAYSVGYTFNNGITIEYRSKNLKDGVDATQELRTIFKW